MEAIKKQTPFYSTPFENLAQVVNNRNKRANTPFTFYPGRGGFYYEDGKEIPENEFNLKYPIDLIKSSNQLDGRTNFY